MAERSDTTTAYAGRPGRVDEWSPHGWRKPWGLLRRPSRRYAKRLRPLVSGFGGLDVNFRFAREQPESVFPREGVHAERGAGECLAVSAIAEQGLVRLDLGFKGNVSAVTTPIDFHRILRNAFMRT